MKAVTVSFGKVFFIFNRSNIIAQICTETVTDYSECMFYSLSSYLKPPLFLVIFQTAGFAVQSCRDYAYVLAVNMSIKKEITPVHPSDIPPYP